MDRATSLRADIAMPDPTMRVDVEHQADAPWSEVTAALIFPYHLDWRRREICATERLFRLRSGDDPSRDVVVPKSKEHQLGVARRTWDPLSLNPTGQRGTGQSPGMTVRDTAYQHWFDPAKYFHSTHLAARVVATSAASDSTGQSNVYEAWVPGDSDAAEAGTALPDRLYDVYSDLVLDRSRDAVKRLHVLGAERHEFDSVRSGDTTEDPGFGFAVLHLKAVGFTSDELTRLSEYISKPSWWKSRGGRGLSVDITRILHGMGLHVQASRGGYTDSCRRRDGSLDCRVDPSVDYVPADVEVHVSGWREQQLRKAYFPGDRRPPTLVYETGCLGGAPGGEPETRGAVGSLPKSVNRVMTLWCLPLDDVRRPSPYSLFHLEESDVWSEAEKWSYQLAAGHRLSGTYALPDDTREEASSGTVHALGCDMRVCSTGVAVLLDPRLSSSQDDFRRYRDRASDGRRLKDLQVDSYVSDPLVRSVVHGRFVELAMLGMRQRFLLAGHVQALARLHERSGGRSDADVDSAIDLEQRFQWFINQRWFEDVPGRPEATRMLTALQEQWGLAAELDRVREEQEGIFRIQTFRHRQRQEAEESRAQRQRQGEIDRHEQARDEERRRRNRNRESFEYLAAVFAPPSLIFGALAVRDDPHPDLFSQGLLWSFIVILLSVLVLGVRSLVARHRGPVGGTSNTTDDAPGSESRPQAPLS